MPDTLRKLSTHEAWAASLRQLRARVPQWRPWLAGWRTPCIAVAAIVGACLFAWGFLSLVLTLVFPRAPVVAFHRPPAQSPILPGC